MGSRELHDSSENRAGPYDGTQSHRVHCLYQPWVPSSFHFESLAQKGSDSCHPRMQLAVPGAFGRSHGSQVVAAQTVRT